MEIDKVAELGLSFKAQLPLKWRVIEDIETYQQPSNNRFMNMSSVLDDPEIHHTDGSTLPNADIARLEAKLDLILELLGDVFAQKKAAPGNTAFQLSASGIAWLANDSPAVGNIIELQIFLSTKFLIPLYLAATVTRVEQQGTVNRVQAQFLPMEESLQEWLEKYIFRQHRREVALQHQTKQ